MKTLNPMTLTRYELIDALRGLLSPDKFHDATYQPTATLRGLLAALQAPKEERTPPPIPRPKKRAEPQFFATIYSFPLYCDPALHDELVILGRGDTIRFIPRRG